MPTNSFLIDIAHGGILRANSLSNALFVVEREMQKLYNRKMKPITVEVAEHVACFTTQEHADTAGAEPFAVIRKPGAPAVLTAGNWASITAEDDGSGW